MTTPRASIATNSRPIAVSDDSRVRRVTTATPPIITTAPTAAPSDPGQAEQDGRRDPRQDAVRERVAEEREAAQDDERADDRTGDRDEHAGRSARSMKPLSMNGSISGPTPTSCASVRSGRECTSVRPRLRWYRADLLRRPRVTHGTRYDAGAEDWIRLREDAGMTTGTGQPSNVDRATAMTEEFLERGAPWGPQTSWRYRDGRGRGRGRGRPHHPVQAARQREHDPPDRGPPAPRRCPPHDVPDLARRRSRPTGSPSCRSAPDRA